MSATFLSLMEAITPGGAFALYGVVCVLGYLFCYFVRDSPIHMMPGINLPLQCQPETAYLTMEETFEQFTESVNPLRIKHKLMVASHIQRFWNRQVGASSRISAGRWKGGRGFMTKHQHRGLAPVVRLSL